MRPILLGFSVAVVFLTLAQSAKSCGSLSADFFRKEETFIARTLDAEKIRYFEEFAGLSGPELTRLPGRIFVRHTDLNQDGTKEICITLATSGTCSMGVGICRMLVLKDWSSAPLLEYAGHHLVQGGSNSSGWSDLVGRRSASDGKIWESTYSFDGAGYIPKGSVVIGSWAKRTCVSGVPFSPLCTQGYRLSE